MKTLSKALLALSASSVLAMSANAAISYGASEAAQPYVGVKVGTIDADQIDGNVTAYGVYGGYNFDQNFGVEAEYLGTDTKDFTANNRALEGDVKTYGLYGTYRYNFNNTPIYAKAKLGVAKTEVDVEYRGNDAQYLNSDKTGVAGGVALGYKPTSNVGLEIGYNYLSKDANMAAIGAHIAF
ncbi:porin family protein [Moraxella sp. FZLJ2107]|uniref:porin family protein n=1 Tax=unclassified Moraxella TaxID=2685852 RepID=UPI00209C1CEB|nr:MULTISPECIES: porin family protein [unclassified Moraxella]USZ15397.1 porin family protein [Moraxella sp. FZFQ2102]UTO04033.1 porin family protein [Moraxella sp. FZLJ2107]UTO22865.1 porin family protein [Moraxella sp. FZLJ2109]